MANVITLEGGDVVISASLDGGDIYPSGGSGGNLQAKSVSYTPTEVSVSDHLTPSAGYDGFSYVDVSIDGISPTYIGSAIPLRNSSDLSAAGATVTAPYGYYGAAATKTIPNASTPTIDSRSVDSSGYVTVDIEIDNGGYIAAGTYSATDSVPLPIQAAQTITPGTTNQTIASGKYLTGAQTILGDADLVASNIKKDVSIFGVTGTYEGGGGGGVTWGEIGSTSVTPSVRNLYAALADSSIEFGSFTLASTPSNAFVDLFTLTSITAPCNGIVIIDDAFYQGASGLPNNGNSEAISYLHFSKAFLNPAKENALASAYPCYGFMAWGVSQTNTSGQAGGSIGANPFDGTTGIARGYFQWNGQTLQWKSQYGGQQYTTFVAGRTYRWIAY